MLDLRHLRSLLAIADTGKLAHAAERVFLTQSALSHQIRALEKHYDITLFQRTAHGLRFTPAGQRILELAKEVTAAVQKAERDLARLNHDHTGELRIALECHTCFDWLMPVMRTFREAWPEVEVDLVAGFHSEPWRLIQEGKADVVVGGLPDAPGSLQSAPLFEFEILAVLPPDHVLRNKPFLRAEDFAGQTLITYPVPLERIDLIRQVLAPAGIGYDRRTAELTIAIMQLVASRRGIAALPNWGITNYVQYEDVIAKPIGRKGLWAKLYASTTPEIMARPYAADLVRIVRDTCASQLEGIRLI